MNPKLEFDISMFIRTVGEYILMEYGDFYEQFCSTNIFDFIGSYYMGGSNVPDTARYVVELIKMNNKTQN